MQVGLMTKRYKWIVTNPDAHTIDLEPFQYSGVELMTFRVLNTNHSVFRGAPAIESDIDQMDNAALTNAKDDFYAKGCEVPVEQLVDLVPVYPDKFNGIDCSRDFRVIPIYFASLLHFFKSHEFIHPTESISLSLSLMYDAVMVFATAIQQLGSDQVFPTPIDCNRRNSVWNKGYTILNFMKSVNS